MTPIIPRQEAMLALGLLFLAGLAVTVARLFRARKHGLSLRLQVFLVLSAATFILTVVFGVIIVDRFQARTVSFAHRAAAEDARVLAAMASRSLTVLSVGLEEGVRGLGDSGALYSCPNDLGEVRVEVVDTRGRVLFDSRGPTAASSSLAHRPEVQAALRGQSDPVARMPEPGRVAAASPIRTGSGILGALRVSRGIVGMQQILADTAPRVGLLALVLAVAAALAGAAIGRTLGLPIERLTRAAEQIARGDRQAALPRPVGREARKLTAAFEAMRAELEQRHQAQVFAADVSHELKNPIASIRAAAEVLEDAVAEDPEAARRFARRIGEAAGRLETLTRDLLSLARLEAEGVAKTRATVDLVALGRKAIEVVGSQAAARAVAVESVEVSPVVVHADPAWLQRALENLLTNAIGYSPAGSTVRLELREAGSLAEAVVSDSGPGLDPAVAERVFERFVTTRQTEGGTGLGLAIVRAVAEAHGGIAEVLETGPTGTRIALRIPRK